MEAEKNKENTKKEKMQKEENSKSQEDYEKDKQEKQSKNVNTEKYHQLIHNRENDNNFIYIFKY